MLGIFEQVWRSKMQSLAFDLQKLALTCKIYNKK